jgi:hypothetical protein
MAERSRATRAAFVGGFDKAATAYTSLDHTLKAKDSTFRGVTHAQGRGANHWLQQAAWRLMGGNAYPRDVVYQQPLRGFPARPDRRR